MYNDINFNDEFKMYVQEIRELRKLKRFCISADDKYDINLLLRKIINEEVYKNDYKNVTYLITYENISYDETIKTIQKIIEHKVFLEEYCYIVIFIEYILYMSEFSNVWESSSRRNDFLCFRSKLSRIIILKRILD